MWWLFIVVGCMPSGQEIPPLCDPRDLDPGEVRIRRIACNDERIEGGDGLRSDWLLENSEVRFVVRDTPSALTRFSAGGSLVDATVVGGTDLLLEAVPLFGEAPLQSASADPSSSEGAVSLVISGEQGVVRYTLRADAPSLEVSGPSAFAVVPRGIADVLGETLDNGTQVLGFDGVIDRTDAGGWVQLSGVDAFVPGPRGAVYPRLWPDGTSVSADAAGRWVEALDADGVPIARLPVQRGAVQGQVPPQTQSLRAVGVGRTPSEPAPVNALVVEASDRADVITRISVPGQGPISATLFWQGSAYPHVPSTPLEALPPGTGEAILYAGPGHELLPLDLTIEAGQEQTLTAAMPWAVTPALLADLDVLMTPDRTDRRAMATALVETAAQGVRFAVMVADDEIALGRPSLSAPWIVAEAGSRSRGAGTPSAWPWSPNIEKPAHGAVDWAGRSADDLQAVMSGRGTRITVVTPDWVALADDPLTWVPRPDLLRVAGLDDLDTAAALYDAQQVLPLVGPLTWVEDIDLNAFSSVDVEAMMLSGRTTATNGPRPILHLGEAGPGALVMDLPDPLVFDVRVEAPTWIPLTTAALIGPGGELLQTWSLEETGDAVRLETQATVSGSPGWVMLACWGESDAPPWLLSPAWAMTTPIWLGD